ncbi:hypothetical protein ES708_25526 [subsurface metagenome]
MGLREIGELCNVGEVTILCWMRKYKIPRRDRIEAIDASHIKRIGNDRYRDKNWLYQKYIIEKKTPKKIGELCNASGNTIREWLIIMMRRHIFFTTILAYFFNF